MTYDKLLVLGLTNIQLEEMTDSFCLPEGFHRILSALKGTSSVPDAQHSLRVDELIEERIVVTFSFVYESGEIEQDQGKDYVYEWEDEYELL